MTEPTIETIDALVGPATPAVRLPAPGPRARGDRRPPGGSIRSACYGEEKIELLDRLGFASTKAENSEPESRDRIGWETIPSSAPAVDPAAAQRSVSAAGRTVLVTGGSRGIGKAIALRLAREGAARVAIGYFRSDSAAEETAEELRALGAEPVLVRGNVTSSRVLEQVEGARAARRPRPQRGDRRHPARARDRGQALGLDAERERTRTPRADAGRRAGRCPPAASIVALSSLGSVRVLENYTLVGHLEGRARGARALPRRRARTAGDPGERGLRRRRRDGRARALPEPRGDARLGRGATRRAGS